MEKTTHKVASYIHSKNERWEFRYPHSPVQHHSYYWPWYSVYVYGFVILGGELHFRYTTSSALSWMLAGPLQGSEVCRVRGPRHDGPCRLLCLCCYHGVLIQEHDELFRACWYARLPGLGLYWQRKRVVTSRLSKPFATGTCLRHHHYYGIMFKSSGAAGSWGPVWSQPALQGSQKRSGGPHSGCPHQVFSLGFMILCFLEYMGC